MRSLLSNGKILLVGFLQMNYIPSSKRVMVVTFSAELPGLGYLVIKLNPIKIMIIGW